MSLWKALAIGLVAGAAVGCAGPGEDPGSASAPGTSPAAGVTPARPPANVERVTPVLPVESIEPVVPFWEALGFTATNPNYVEGRLNFIAFSKDGLDVHYQSLAEIDQKSAAASADLAGSTAMIYITVDDLDAIVERLGNAEIVIPRRQTPWGSDELYVREPGGHLIAFASFGGS